MYYIKQSKWFPEILDTDGFCNISISFIPKVGFPRATGQNKYSHSPMFSASGYVLYVNVINDR